MGEVGSSSSSVFAHHFAPFAHYLSPEGEMEMDRPKRPLMDWSITVSKEEIDGIKNRKKGLGVSRAKTP